MKLLLFSSYLLGLAALTFAAPRGVARQVAADDRLTSAAKSAAVKQPAAGFMEIIGFVKGIMGIYDSIVNPSTKELADLIKQGFSDVERELYDIQQSINDLISIIADQSMRTQYASTERVITESLRCYNAYLNMTQQEGKDYWRGEFLKTGSLLRESVSFLLDGMLGRNVFAGDIVATVTDAEKCHPRHVQERIDRFMGLINTGIYVHAAYVQLYPISPETNAPFRDLVSSSYDQTETRVANTVHGCRNEDGVENEMSDIMTKYSQLDDEHVLDNMFDFLADKYDTKSWFVLVYYPLSGFDNHAIEGVFHSVFRVGGKNAVAFSVANPPAKFDGQSEQAFRNFPGNRYSNALDAINDLGSQGCNGQRAAIKRLSGLFGKYHDNIDVLWTNFDHLSVIAIPY